MRKNIDIDLFRTFVAVNDQGGFIKAGNALGRSQSAVSMQMKRLEDICEINLFRRAGRKMKLTPSGETLLGYARRILNLHDQTLEALNESEIIGKANLAVMGDYATYILPGILAGFISQYPSIQIEVTTGFSSELLKHLGEQFEIVLTTQQKGFGKGEVLRTERTRWAFSTKHSLPEDGIVPLALLPPGNMFREWALEALDEAEVRWRIIFTSTSIAAVEAAAEAGIAVTVVKEGTARAGLKLLGPHDGFPILPESEIALHRAPGILSKAAHTLATFLVQSLKK